MNALETAQLLKSKGFVQNFAGEWSKPETVATRLPDSKPERNTWETLDGCSSLESTRSSRTLLRITRYATRCLDFDNGAGGCKALVDQIRYYDLIFDDDPEEIDFQFRQVKVKTKAEEGTEILITRS